MESTVGTIIRLVRFSDTSVIVHWFTGTHGLVKTIAKGALRPKSPFAGKLDLFFENDIVFQPTRRGDLHHIREASPRDFRANLRKTHATLSLASYFCQLLERAVEPEHPDEPMHDLLRRGLGHLGSSPPGMKALTHFENELARLLGLARPGVPGHHSLEELLGRLPSSRALLTEIFSPPDNSARQP